MAIVGLVLAFTVFNAYLTIIRWKSGGNIRYVGLLTMFYLILLYRFGIDLAWGNSRFIRYVRSAFDSGKKKSMFIPVIFWLLLVLQTYYFFYYFSAR